MSSVLMFTVSIITSAGEALMVRLSKTSSGTAMYRVSPPPREEMFSVFPFCSQCSSLSSPSVRRKIPPPSPADTHTAPVTIWTFTALIPSRGTQNPSPS